jgi:hypothetical protein
MIDQLAGANDVMVVLVDNRLYIRNNYHPNARWTQIAPPPNCGGMRQLMVVQHGVLHRETLIMIYGYDVTGQDALWQGESSDVKKRGELAWNQVAPPVLT